MGFLTFTKTRKDIFANLMVFFYLYLSLTFAVVTFPKAGQILQKLPQSLLSVISSFCIWLTMLPFFPVALAGVLTDNKTRDLFFNTTSDGAAPNVLGWLYLINFYLFFSLFVSWPFNLIKRKQPGSR